MAATKCQTNVECHCFLFIHWFWDKALTSSYTSRTAAPHGSSSGSIPPPGTIHWSGCRLLLTSITFQGEKPSSQLCCRALACQKHASGTHWFGVPHRYWCLVPFSGQDVWGRSLMSHLSVIVFFLMHHECKVALLLSLHTPSISVRETNQTHLTESRLGMLKLRPIWVNLFREKKHVHISHSRGPCLWIGLNLYPLLVIHTKKIIVHEKKCTTETVMFGFTITG